MPIEDYLKLLEENDSMLDQAKIKKFIENNCFPIEETFHDLNKFEQNFYCSQKGRTMVTAWKSYEEAIKKKHYNTAAEIFIDLLDKGYHRALTEIRNITTQEYLFSLFACEGDGVDELRYRTYLQSIESEVTHIEDSHEPLILAMRYFLGLGVQRCLTKAVEHLFKAEKNSCTAQNLLGYLYEIGCGVQRDTEKANYYYRLAADGQYNLALHNLARSYFKNGHFSKAINLYKRTVSQGFAPSMYELGLCYHSGSGVENNLTQAKKWYQFSASQYFPPAQYELVQLKQKDNYRRTIEIKDLLKAAAKGGNEKAQYDLSKFYPDHTWKSVYYRRLAAQHLYDARYGLKTDFSSDFPQYSLLVINWDVKRLLERLESAPIYDSQQLFKFEQFCNRDLNHFPQTKVLIEQLERRIKKTGSAFNLNPLYELLMELDFTDNNVGRVAIVQLLDLVSQYWREVEGCATRLEVITRLWHRVQSLTYNYIPRDLSNRLGVLLINHLLGDTVSLREDLTITNNQLKLLFGLHESHQTPTPQLLETLLDCRLTAENATLEAETLCAPRQNSLFSPSEEVATEKKQFRAFGL
ncbi:hypothetical protein A8135_08985 [Legionella jamestowniensis]|uniref:TPR repeat protein n=1 Tax=Legionella jamestowniensis TaxID=455 RepID=A0ABX2XWF9_9GAMM|nr:tetratricopeptide repeat protein [Legionella jamestowniensis]OCH98886.1 hypothetical protein A8135_08985 [Legionella jamestowniensis]